MGSVVLVDMVSKLKKTSVQGYKLETLSTLIFLTQFKSCACYMHQCISLASVDFALYSESRSGRNKFCIIKPCAG